MDHARQHPGDQLAVFIAGQFDSVRLVEAVPEVRVQLNQVTGKCFVSSAGLRVHNRPPRLPTRTDSYGADYGYAKRFVLFLFTYLWNAETGQKRR